MKEEKTHFLQLQANEISADLDSVQSKVMGEKVLNVTKVFCSHRNTEQTAPPTHPNTHCKQAAAKHPTEKDDIEYVFSRIWQTNAQFGVLLFRTFFFAGVAPILLSLFLSLRVPHTLSS